MTTQTYQQRSNSAQNHPVRSILLSIGIVVGILLLLRACTGANTTVTPSNAHATVVAVATAVPALAPAADQGHGPKPTTMPDASQFPAGTVRDVTKYAPAGWQPMPDCKSKGMRTWTHEDAAGNISFYCKP